MENKEEKKKTHTCDLFSLTTCSASNLFARCDKETKEKTKSREGERKSETLVR